jgi:hypothetical protein
VKKPTPWDVPFGMKLPPLPVLAGAFAFACALSAPEVARVRAPRGATVTRVTPAPGVTATVWTVPGATPRAQTVVVWLSEP